MLDASGQTSLIYEPFNPVLEQTGLCTAEFDGFTYIGDHNEQRYRLPLARTLSYSYDIRQAFATMEGTKGFKKRVREWCQTILSRRGRRRPLMKDPIAVFSSEWLARTFNMSVVVMIRHPAAFVASILRLGWSHNFVDILNQTQLMTDHLNPFIAEIQSLATEPEYDLLDQAALMWKLIYHVIDVYRTEHPEWCFVLHEELSLDPLYRFQEIYRYAGLEFSRTAASTIRQHSDPRNEVNAPDGVATQLMRDSARVIDGWKRSLSPDQIARIRNCVEPVSSRFYGSSSWNLG